MKVRFLLCVMSCLCVVSIGGTLAAVPDKTPVKDKDTQVKELVAELKALRQRVDQVEKRLTELKSVPVLVRMSYPRENGHAAMRRAKPALMLVSLNTDQKKSESVSARELFNSQPFRFHVEIPHEDAKQPPLRVQCLAKPEDDWGSNEMDAYVLVPREARLGYVEIKISWPASHRIAEGSTTKRVYIFREE